MLTLLGLAFAAVGHIIVGIIIVAGGIGEAIGTKDEVNDDHL